MTIALQASNYHYHWPNYQVDGPPQFDDIQNIKNKIGNIFLGRFASYNGLVNSNENQQKAIQLLKDFSSGGVIGAKITDHLNNLAFDTADQEGNQFSSLGTEGTFNWMMDNLKVEIPDEAARTLEVVNRMWNMLVDTLANSKQDLMVSQLKKIWSGQPLDPIFAETGTLVHNGFYSERQISLSEVIAQKHFENLMSAVNQLKNPPQDLNLSNILEAVRSSFSNIGGDMLEPVAAHSINLAAADIRKIKKETDKAFQQSVNKVGGYFYAEPVGSDRKENGSQQKNDIEIHYHESGLIYSFGGSIKNRQGKSNIKSQGQITDLHHGLTLGALAEATLRDNGQSSQGEYYGAVLGAYKTTLNNRSRLVRQGTNQYNAALNSWESMREAAQLSGLLLALSGSGKKGDFSGIFVFNNTVYSVYDILMHSIQTYKNGNTNLASSITPGYAMSGKQFADTKKKINDYIRLNNQKTKKDGIGATIARRQTYTSDTIQSLLNTKVEINLSFTTLINAGLT